jgi:hypothetical protein
MIANKVYIIITWHVSILLCYTAIFNGGAVYYILILSKPIITVSNHLQL